MTRISPESGRGGKFTELLRDIDGYSQMNSVNCAFTIPSQEAEFTLNGCPKWKMRLERNLGIEMQRFSTGKQEVRQ